MQYVEETGQRITLNHIHYVFLFQMTFRHDPEVWQPITIHPVQNSNVTCYLTRAHSMWSLRQLEKDDEIEVRNQAKFHICQNTAIL